MQSLLLVMPVLNQTSAGQHLDRARMGAAGVSDVLLAENRKKSRTIFHEVKNTYRHSAKEGG